MIRSKLLQRSSQCFYRAKPLAQSWQQSGNKFPRRTFATLPTEAPVGEPRQHHHQQQQKRHTEAMRHSLQRYGYLLASVNPLRPDGFLLEPSLVSKSLPKNMITLLNVLTDMRLQNKSASFSNAVKARICQPSDSHVTVHSEDIAVLQELVHSYCGQYIGFETDHCNTENERQFFTRAIEDPEGLLSSAGYNDVSMDPAWMFEQLYRTEVFERLVHERYSNAKTFGIEGMESATLAINTLVESFAATGEGEGHNNNNKTVLLGTSHRGRLNYIANCLRVPWTKIISDWDTNHGPTYDDINDPCTTEILPSIRSGKNTADTTTSTKTCTLTMLPIPCHLEAMVPGLLGFARAKATMEIGGSKEGQSVAVAPASQLVLPLSLHGDSSFCGQGIIQETLQLSLCRHYECGGTIHLLLNNQVGFTTELSSIKKADERSQSTQSSDIMKSIGAPILHVNANQPFAVVRACQIALLYRQIFGSDILIDLVGWRRRGHNELDDPTMTNVKLHAAINEVTEPVTSSFPKEMEPHFAKEFDLVRQKVDNLYQSAKNVRRDDGADAEHEHYDRLIVNKSSSSQEIMEPTRSPITGISKRLLQEASAPLITVPHDFKLHPLVSKAIDARRKCLLQSDGRLDWATAELLALSSLASEGVRVRLSGEDSERGTFAQRHAIWHDAITGEEHQAFPTPLMEVANSPLSELGVVGFEYGWSLYNNSNNSLVLWEAQFGDFSNEAQVIFDTLLSSGASKWNVESNLVLLLPHGYDGMGPEHSCSRPERWLQMFASDEAIDSSAAGVPSDPDGMYRASNLVVACPTEPANYFHLLRRQLVWPFRRPLIVLSPKRTLRNTAATSSLRDVLSEEDNGHGSGHDHEGQFSCVLDDPHWNATTRDKEFVSRMLICSGEFYFDLAKLREHHEELSNVALVRLEQLAPFPGHALDAIIETYPNLKHVAWAQEEPANYGALSFVREQITSKKAVPSLRLVNVSRRWISRPESAAPAIGRPKEHTSSQQKVIQDVLDWAAIGN